MSKKEIEPCFVSVQPIAIDLSKLDELIDHLPLYEHTQPQTKEHLFDLWKQSIKQILRDLIQSEVKPYIEQSHALFQKYVKEIEHIQQFEQELYKAWKEVNTNYENLQYHLRLYKSSWAMNFADKLPDLEK